MLPDDVARRGVECTHRTRMTLPTNEGIATRCVEQAVAECQVRRAPIAARRALAADEEMLPPHGSCPDVGAVERIDIAVLIDGANELVAARVAEEHRRGAPVGIEDGLLLWNLPGARDGKR